MFIPVLSQNNVRRSIVQQLQSLGALTFFKDYSALPVGTVTATQLNADYAGGVATATYTSARSASAPATYVDASGVVQLVTDANVGRIQGGFYDATGFHTVDSNSKTARGLMIEAAGTNLITKSNNVEDAIFTKTNVTADNDDAGSSSPDGTATAPSLTATANDGTFLLAAGVTAQTYSVFIKRKTGTGTISITANGGTAYSAVTVTSGWARFSVTAASAAQTCGIKIGTSGDAVYVWTNQFENNPYMTSPIPTTTAALTRPAEVLKYAIAGNRTAATESIFIGFALSYDSVSGAGGSYRHLTNTNTDARILVYKNSTSSFLVSPSQNVVAWAGSVQIANPYLRNTSVVVCGIPISSTGDPNTRIHLNAGDGVSTNNDWGAITNFGATFSIGSNSSGVEQLNGIIKNATFYSDAKAAPAVASISTLLGD